MKTLVIYHAGCYDGHCAAWIASKVLPPGTEFVPAHHGTGDRLAQGRPFSATFFIRADGKRVWSLRSREGGIDVSVIAKAHGGGGHAQAAGFQE